MFTFLLKQMARLIPALRNRGAEDADASLVDEANATFLKPKPFDDSDLAATRMISDPNGRPFDAEGRRPVGDGEERRLSWPARDASRPRRLSMEGDTRPLATASADDDRTQLISSPPRPAARAPLPEDGTILVQPGRSSGGARSASLRGQPGQKSEPGPVGAPGPSFEPVDATGKIGKIDRIGKTGEAEAAANAAVDASADGGDPGASRRAAPHLEDATVLVPSRRKPRS